MLVCDLTACVGGNVLSFGKQFDYVYGIEIDPTRHRMLQNNVRVMHDYRTSGTSGTSGRNLQRPQIHTACGDAVLLLQPTPPGNTLVQAFLSKWSPSSVGMRIDEMIYFLDPPWGGLNYKNQSSISLTLGTTPIATVVALCLQVRFRDRVRKQCTFEYLTRLLLCSLSPLCSLSLNVLSMLSMFAWLSVLRTHAAVSWC